MDNDNYSDDEPKDFNDFLVGDTPFDTSPEAIAFLKEDHDADWEFYGIDLH